MATASKISQLTTAGPLTGAELVPVVQSGGTLQTTVSALKVFSLGNVVAEVSSLDARVAAVSALATQNATAIASVQTDLADLTTRVANVSASVSVLNTQMTQVQASISAINSLLAAIDVSAINTLLPAVSALEIRVSAVSAAVSVNTADIASLNITVANVSARTSVNAAAITSVNNVVSAQGIRLDAVSAATVSLAFSVSIVETRVSAVSAVAAANTLAITSVNAVVSALDVRVASVSAQTSVNAAAITSINAYVSVIAVTVANLYVRVDNTQASVSALQTQVANVSTSVSALNVQMAAVQASVSAINSVLAAIDASALASLEPRVSALEIRVTNVSASVSVLNVQMLAVQTSISTINSVLNNIDASALASLEPRVSALEIRVGVVSAATSVNAAAITSLNAVVSTKANRNGDHLTNVQYIDFNTTTSYAPLPGRLTWDIESGTLDLGLTGTVNLLIGQRTVAEVYNNSGVTLPKGKAVRVTGSQGQRLTGALAQADSDADSLTIFGIMLETVSVNNSGYVATDGLVRNVNTLGFTDGAVVFLSPVSAGELTPIKPVAPQHLVQMGYIVKGGSGGAGEIYVKVQNGYELGELHDVKVSASTSLADGEVLAYNVSAQVWTNSPALINAQASISALNIQVAAVSALVSSNTAAITSINNAVSAALTSLNASNLTTGLVPTARLASGTANSTTFLRGDQTWAVPTSGGGGGGAGETFNAFLLMGG